jgi:hypothetical protein
MMLADAAPGTVPAGVSAPSAAIAVLDHGRLAPGRPPGFSL